MKNILLTIMMFFSTLFAYCDNVPAFNKVSVNVNSKIKFIESDKFEVDVQNQDKTNPVIWEINDQKELKFKYLRQERDLDESPKVIIRIKAPVLPKVYAGRDFLITETPKQDNTDESSKN